MNNFVVGIAGGSASGKTTVAKELQREFNNELILLQLDSYYKNFSMISKEKRDNINFDHPLSFDFDLFEQHIVKLKQNKSIKKLDYDYVNHLRFNDGSKISPKRIIVIEGILLYFKKSIRNLMDIKIFVDAPPDIRFIRRLKRDIIERNRTTESIIKQYHSTVRPMHLEFIEPTKQFADLIIPKGGKNQIAIDLVISRLNHLINKS